MNASAIVWTLISRLYAAGHPRLATRLANVVGSGRSFSVDEDGHWRNASENATFASPDVHSLRHAYLGEVVADEWLYDYKPEKNAIVFDIGAGIGEEAVILSPMVKHIYAIEAHPETFRCLEKTVRLSGLKNVTPIQCALADTDGEVTIDTGANHLSSSIMNTGGETVKARSLASLCKELGIEKVDFLRVNIEGAERLAVRGFGDIIVENLAVSCHDFIPGAQFQTRKAVKDFLESAGYHVKGRPDHARPWTREMIYASLKR